MYHDGNQSFVWRGGCLLVTAVLLMRPVPALRAAVATDFYVATNGNDANPGTNVAQPFLTLSAAIAAEEAAGTNVHRNIYIRGGEYFNVTALLQGSGTPGQVDCNLTIAGYSNEVAKIYGGILLTNWTSTSNGWWTAPLPPYPSAQAAGVNLYTSWTAAPVRMLLVDGGYVQRARYPTNGTDLYYSDTSGTGPMHYRNHDLDTIVASNAEVQVDSSWDAQIAPVSSINVSTKAVSFAPGFLWGSRGLDYAGLQSYRVWNIVEGMSTPGQFYFDKVHQKIVYYPVGGKNPNTSEIIVPVTSTVFKLRGYDGASGVQNLTISNLTIQCCAMDVEVAGGFDFNYNYCSLIDCGDSAGGQSGFAANLSIVNCKLGWTSGSAIGGDYGFNTNALVTGCEVAYCGNYGICLRMAPCVVSNNYIHDIGLINWEAPSIRVSEGAVVVKNSIFNSTMTAIGDYSMHNCKIMFNNISNAMTVLRDMGAFYCYNGSNNVITSNLFQNIGRGVQFDGNDARDYFRPAVYFDELTTYSVMQSNVVFNSKMPFFCNIATSNAVVNNVFINTNGEYLRMYTSADSLKPNRVERNVFISSTNIIVDNPSNWNSWAGNIFWSTSNPPLTNNVPAGATIADPMFSSLSAYELQFQAGSPAPTLGISPITLFAQSVGVGSTPRLLMPPSDLHIKPSP